MSAPLALDMRVSRVLSIVAVLLVAPAAALAQEPAGDAESRRLFSAGQAAYEGGRYREAADLFERCHAITGAPELLYNAARSAERGGDSERAIGLYRRFIATDPAETDRVAAEERVRELRARTATLGTPRSDRRGTEPLPTEPSRPVDQGGGLLDQWWFWTLAGVVIAGAVVTTLLLTSDAGTQDPLRGDVGPGGVVAALQVSLP